MLANEKPQMFSKGCVYSIQVSDFSKCDGARKYNRFHSSGVLIVWEYNYHEETENETTTEEEESSEDEVETVSAVSPSHKTSKCIGATRTVEYQSALREVRDLMALGHSVFVELLHEPSNPRDSRALAFVCCINGERRTIGYVVSRLVEKVHSAIDSGSIISVDFAWVRYITDWSRSGPGFFAGISIEKRGRWSDTAERYSSTR